MFEKAQKQTNNNNYYTVSCLNYHYDLVTNYTMSQCTPHIIVTATVLLLSMVGIIQSKLGTITVGVMFWVETSLKATRWIPPTVGTAPLSSSDRVTMIGIL